MTYTLTITIPFDFDDDGPYFEFSDLAVRSDVPLSTDEKQDLIHQLGSAGFLRAAGRELGVSV